MQQHQNTRANVCPSENANDGGVARGRTDTGDTKSDNQKTRSVLGEGSGKRNKKDPPPPTGDVQRARKTNMNRRRRVPGLITSLLYQGIVLFQVPKRPSNRFISARNSQRHQLPVTASASTLKCHPELPPLKRIPAQRTPKCGATCLHLNIHCILFHALLKGPL